TLLSALVETRRRTLRASASEMKVTLTRFGRKRRLVLMFEWLTLWPTWGPLAVSSQRRDILKILFHPRPWQSALSRPAGVQIHVHFQEPRTYRGRRPGGQGCLPGLEAGISLNARGSSHLRHHIKGAIPADIM